MQQQRPLRRHPSQHRHRPRPLHLSRLHPSRLHPSRLHRLHRQQRQRATPNLMRCSRASQPK
ncbi:hypothetical protein BVI1335_70153 [Burkholderia vietnamiensis]|nr:hypothetical protein BVI1335_70153 [Burkholderia vietnamiensis]